MLYLILLAVIGILIFVYLKAWYQLRDESYVKQLNFYLLSIDTNQKEFEKKLWVAFLFDYEDLSEKQFNQRWKAVCKMSNVVPLLNTAGHIDPNYIIPRIAEFTYTYPPNKKLLELLQIRYKNFDDYKNQYTKDNKDFGKDSI